MRRRSVLYALLWLHASQHIAAAERRKQETFGDLVARAASDHDDVHGESSDQTLDAALRQDCRMNRIME